jgi:hypothetical protein
MVSSLAPSTIIGVFFLLPQIERQPPQNTARMRLHAEALRQNRRQNRDQPRTIAGRKLPMPLALRRRAVPQAQGVLAVITGDRTEFIQHRLPALPIRSPVASINGLEVLPTRRVTHLHPALVPPQGYISRDATGNIFRCLDSRSTVTFNVSRFRLHFVPVGCMLRSVVGVEDGNSC